MSRIQVCQDKDFRVRLPSSNGKYINFVKIRTLYDYSDTLSWR